MSTWLRSKLRRSTLGCYWTAKRQQLIDEWQIVPAICKTTSAARWTPVRVRDSSF